MRSAQAAMCSASSVLLHYICTVFFSGHSASGLNVRFIQLTNLNVVGFLCEEKNIILKDISWVKKRFIKDENNQTDILFLAWRECGSCAIAWARYLCFLTLRMPFKTGDLHMRAPIYIYIQPLKTNEGAWHMRYTLPTRHLHFVQPLCNLTAPPQLWSPKGPRKCEKHAPGNRENNAQANSEQLLDYTTYKQGRHEFLFRHLWL